MRIRWTLGFVVALVSGAVFAQVTPPSPEALAQLYHNACVVNAPSGEAPATDPPPGAAYLSPGRYMDVRRGGHGWDFFWYTDEDASNLATDPQELFVVWYTHRLEGGIYRPVWFGASGKLVYNNPSAPTRILGFAGELVEVKQFPATPGAGFAGAGATQVGDGTKIGTVTLAFTNLELDANPHKVAVSYTLGAEVQAQFPGGPIDRTVTACLDHFGGLEDPPPAPDPMTGLSGSWVEPLTSGWMLLAYFYESFEHHLLLYFEGTTNSPTGTPRWVHATVPYREGDDSPELPQHHACHDAPLLPPGADSSWAHLCMLTVRGYSPYQTAAQAQWEWDNYYEPEQRVVHSQVRLGWLSHEMDAGSDVAKLRATKDEEVLLPAGVSAEEIRFEIRPADSSTLLSGPTTITHINNLSRVKVVDAAGQPFGENGVCAPDANAQCAGTVNWYTDGAWPHASLFRSELGGSGATRRLAARSTPRSRSLGVALGREIPGRSYIYELFSDAARTELLARSPLFRIGTGTSSCGTATASVTAPAGVVPLPATALTVGVGENPAACTRQTLVRIVRRGSSTAGDLIVWEGVRSEMPGGVFSIPRDVIDSWGGLDASFQVHAILFDAGGVLANATSDFTFGAPFVGDAPHVPDPTIASDASPLVGIPSGKAGVDGGAATYELPIRVPPGVNGMQPKLSLVYSSRSGNGIAGMGWSLSGLSSIHRCPRTVAQDGKSAAVSFNADDALCLDGQRLIYVGGGTGHGTNLAQYRTEIETFVRVTQSGELNGTGSTVPSFLVHTRENLVLEYGKTPTARFAPAGAGGKVLTWAINRRADLAGNALTYSYASDANGQRVSSITYGPASTPSAREIRFEYEARPTTGADDIGSSYVGGAGSTSLQRLTGVRSRVGSDVVFGYDLEYGAASAHSGRSLLRKIKQSARGIQLPPLDLDWSESDASYVTAKVASSTEVAQFLSGAGTDPLTSAVQIEELDQSIQSATTIPTGDFDGDGRREVLFRTIRDSQYLVSFATDRSVRGAISLDAIGGVDLAMSAATFVDFDNDGRSDIVARGTPASPSTPPNLGQPGILTIRFWSGASGVSNWTTNDFQLVKTGIAVNGTDNVHAGDLNGDGRSDFLVDKPTASQTCNRQLVAHINESAASPRAPTFAAQTVSFCLGTQSDNFTKTFGHLEDFNGDGTLDVIVQRGNNAGAETTSDILLGRRTTTGLSYEPVTFASVVPSPNDETLRASLWLDINGDGLRDLAYPRTVADDTGHPLDEPGNGDERRWFVRVNQGGRLGSEIDTHSTRGLESLRPYQRQPMDVDGDGRQELLIPAKLELPVCILHRAEVGRFPRVHPNGPDDGDGGGEEGPGDPEDVTNGGSSPEEPTIDFWDTDFYWCPEDPVTGLPPDLEINDAPTFPLYGLDGPAGFDYSAYRMDALEFVQTGAEQFVVRSRPTSIVTRLNGAMPDDLYGDGLSDVVADIGCPIGTDPAHPYPYPACAIPPTRYGGGTWSFAPIASEPGLLTQLASERRSFVSRNRGIVVNGIERDVAPELPDLVRRVYWRTPSWQAGNSDVESVSWQYFPLAASLPTTNGRELPLYSVPARGSNNGYVDAAHIYFASSMPVVSEMLESTGVGNTAVRRVFAYEEAMYNTQGRGFRGFRRVSEDNLTAATRRETVFAQKFPMSGVAECSETISLDGRLHQRRCTGGGSVPIASLRSKSGQQPTPVAVSPLVVEVAEFDKDSTCTGAGIDAGKLCMFVRERASTVERYDSISTFLLTRTTTVSSYDSDGNVTSSNTIQRDYEPSGQELARREATVASVFAPRAEEAWWLGRLQSRTTSRSVVYGAGHAPPGAAPPARAQTELVAYNETLRVSRCVATFEGGVPAAGVACDFAAVTGAVAPDRFVRRVVTGFDPAGNVATVSSVARQPTAQGTGWTIAAERGESSNWAGSGYFFPSLRINAEGHDVTTEFDAATGQPTKVTDANDLVTRTFYDGLGRATRVEYPTTAAGVSARPKILGYQWCTSGVCVALPEALYRIASGQAGGGRAYEYYDRKGRLLRSEVEDRVPGRFVASERIYNEDGTLFGERGPAFVLSPGSGLQQGPQVDYEYDLLDRVVEKSALRTELDPGPGSPSSFRLQTRYDYTGLTTNITVQRSDGAQPPLSMSRTHASSGELLSTVDAANQKTSFWYDGASNPVAIRNVKGGLLTADYNDAGERVGVTDPDRGSWTFRYNGFGDLVYQKDARGWGGVNFLHDSLGRVVQRDWTDADPLNAGTGYPMRDTWVYDTLKEGALTSARRERTSGGLGRDEFTRTIAYDNLARPASELTTITLPNGEIESLEVQFDYDAGLGRLKSRQLPGLETVYYEYSDTGQLIEQGDASRFAGYTAANGFYERIDDSDAFGHPTSIALRGPVATAQRTDTYDAASGLLRSTETPGILSLAYRYDAYGNLTEQRDLASGRAERYGYDALQRLTSSTRSGAGSAGGTTYRYDALGNFLVKSDFSAGDATTAGYTYSGPTSSQVTSVTLAAGGNVSYGYDANGNVVSRTAPEQPLSLLIGYDIDNHALSIKRPATGGGQPTDDGSRFRYGPDGQRYLQEMRKPGQGIRTLIYLDKQYEKEISGAGVVERWYLPGGALRIRSTVPSVQSGLYFVHADRLGSTTVMTDRDGQVIAEERRSFDPFGRPRPWANWSGTEDPTLLHGPRNRRGFTQHEHVDRTNLIHMNGRIFDAELGRFYGVDPFIQFPSNSQSLNPYSYILNNPMAGTDPTGYIGDACPSGASSSECRFNMASGGGYTTTISWGASSGNGGGERQEASRQRPSSQGGGPAVAGLPMLATVAQAAGAGAAQRLATVEVTSSLPRPMMTPEQIARALGHLKDVGMRAASRLFVLTIILTPGNVGQYDDSCPTVADFNCGGRGPAVSPSLPTIMPGAGADSLVDWSDGLMYSEGEPGTAESDLGCIYCVPGDKTRSGRDYVGSTNDLAERARSARDGRDRTGAPVVGTYPKNDLSERKRAEQQAMNDRGGIENLDNKRNEIRSDRWPDYGVTPPR